MATTDTQTQEWYDGLADGKLLLQKCDDCGKVNLYPKYACPFCQSESLGWTEASGKGVLHSLTICRQSVPMGFEEDVPYGLGIVFLEEGPHLLARIVADEDGEWSGYELDGALELDVEKMTAEGARHGAYFRRAA